MQARSERDFGHLRLISVNALVCQIVRVKPLSAGHPRSADPTDERALPLRRAYARAMTSTDDPHRLAAACAKDRCVKCAYPITGGNDVFIVIQRFKEMLQHVGYTTSRFCMDEKEADCIDVTISLRPTARAPKASSSKPHVHEDPQTGLPRHCNLGTSSCCSTNSLCKAHACRHHEEASKPASSPGQIPTADMPFPSDSQNDAPQYGADQLPLPQADRSTSQQAGRSTQHSMFAVKVQPPPVSMALHQTSQKLDAVDNMALHRSPTASGTMGLLSAQHLDAQKTHMTSVDDDAVSRGVVTSSAPHTRALGVDSRNASSSAKKIAARDGPASLADRHVHADQGLQHARLWSSEDRLSGTMEPLFQRSLHATSLQAGSLQAGSLQGGSMQTRAFSRAPENRRSTQTHPLQQSGDALAHEISRGLSNELQMMDQTSDYPPLAALADDHMHGPSSLTGPQVTPVAPVPPRLSLQQTVGQSGDWALTSRTDGGLVSAEQNSDGNRLGSATLDDGRVGASGRLDFGSASRNDGSPAAKRARTGGGAMARAAGDTQGSDGAVEGVAGSLSVSSPGIPQCKQCAKSFSNELELQQHEAKDHSSPAPKNMDGRYPCTVKDCDQSFVRRHVMKRHVKTVHLKIREFACESCGRFFADSSTREVHRSAVHEKKRPWSCDLCPSSFTQSSSLGKHKRRFHGEQKTKGASSSKEG